MNELFLSNALIALEEGFKRGCVLISDGRIGEVVEDEPGGVANRFDLGGAYLAPGMIDIHIHGSAGVDVMEADAAALRKLSQFLLAEGVTGYFATLVPTDDRGYKAALAEIDSYIKRQNETERNGGEPSGARLLGVHFEGPFVSPARSGALAPAHFRQYDGDPSAIEIFTEQATARLMTLAPEIAGGIDLIRDLSRRGVRLFIGHTQADPQTLDLAVKAGARHITHFPNALDPLHHRKPGAVGWGLVRGDVTVDCIADFQHVHPLMLELIIRSKTVDHVALISDAILPTGLGDGEFRVWGERISVRNGKTALAAGPAEGTIAGSVITMNQALKNVIGMGVAPDKAIRMATIVPARAAGVDLDVGSIEVGKRADLVVFDKDFNVRMGIIGGKVAFDSRPSN
ncbi:MAG TPA: N-acetylglucosamine-6-phosphate deacetylase [Blastocatellia bacterium]|nr:N-acetylglucosamine-6-phosphate deacetylase [Blastocatellia bacterium]